MAAITNQQAVEFANKRARTIADLIEKLRRTCDIFLIDVVQNFENYTGGNANGDVVADGSALDGRNPVTKLNMAELKYVVEQTAAALNQDDRAAIVHRFAVNGTPIY